MSTMGTSYSKRTTRLTNSCAICLDYFASEYREPCIVELYCMFVRLQKFTWKIRGSVVLFYAVFCVYIWRLYCQGP